MVRTGRVLTCPACGAWLGLPRPEPRRLEAWARRTLRARYRPGVLASPLWRMRPIELVALLVFREGRAFIGYHWQAWTALPGERWRDHRRMVEGEVVGGRPGHARVRVVGDLERHRLGIDHVDEAPWAGRVERDVDLRSWYRIA